ncbi:DUF2029 domain-containing protein [Cryobacterium melibiosiphilum]|uniref:DUF2029 domain-containing protein n=1 Tax=Cryobacterium melibiosiphilum TaxID=995039 RepID=A0A3A5MM46_9MICO|nr:glycosyltransferase 87 family protein [Cryobacterium melibiosiphilum]RJT91177.1 DUF2029 domain-containing protein [Cryobacterium melibiosiphilum]
MSVLSQLVDRIDTRVARFLTPERRRRLQRPRTLILAFIALHVVFFTALAPMMLTGRVLGDLPLYRRWAELGFDHGVWQGIDTEWVYPIGAMGPIAFANIGGPYLYQFMWFLMTALLNAAAVAALTDFGRRRSGFTAAWWFLAASFLLSPVGLLRLEGLTAPLVIVGLVLIARRPVVAAVLLTLATWIKVWPAAVVLAVVVASRRRVTMIVTGTAVTAAIAASVWLLGGLRYLTGFVTEQTDRALQLEAPVSTPWVWLALVGQPETSIYQNYEIATREIRGPGAEAVAALMTPLMFGALGLIFVLMLLARRRGHDPAQLLLLGALALVTAFVVFNKVGSPQYMLWIAPVVAAGMLRSWHRWRVPAYLMLVIAGLTTLVFPVFYLPLIAGDPFSLVLLTLRNGLLVVLFGWAVLALVQLVRAPGTPAALPATTDVRPRAPRTLSR